MIETLAVLSPEMSLETVLSLLGEESALLAIEHLIKKIDDLVIQKDVEQVLLIISQIEVLEMILKDLLKNYYNSHCEMTFQDLEQDVHYAADTVKIFRLAQKLFQPSTKE